MRINKALFWDTEISKLDFEKNARAIIERVITRGTLDDWFELKNYYGEKRIKQEIVKIRYLDKININFCSKYFQIPRKKFRCYNTSQSSHQLWNF